MKKVLITGASGLVGSEAVKFFAKEKTQVYGVDNNMRAYFFGNEASNHRNTNTLLKKCENYKHHNFDIRNSSEVSRLFECNKFDLIIHAAAQPSHDWSATKPVTDFEINANGTLILLEAFRKFCPKGVFVFISTNKVYGDNPNKLPFIEYKYRYELSKKHTYYGGVDESMSVDMCKHSPFGVSKLAADILVQEYGRYFGLYTASFRCGCITGPAHSGAKLHGFLSYLTHSIVNNKSYTIFGYKGKQVRDNIHSYDLVSAIYHFYRKPQKGAVYNIGGSRSSNISILEAIEEIEAYTGKKAKIKYDDTPRVGDHIWYISNMQKFRKNYPAYEYKYNIDGIIEELCISS